MASCVMNADKFLPDNPAFCHIQVPSGASSARNVAKTGLCVSTGK